MNFIEKFFYTNLFNSLFFTFVPLILLGLIVFLFHWYQKKLENSGTSGQIVRLVWNFLSATFNGFSFYALFLHGHMFAHGYIRLASACFFIINLSSLIVYWMMVYRRLKKNNEVNFIVKKEKPSPETEMRNAQKKAELMLLKPKKQN